MPNPVLSPVDALRNLVAAVREVEGYWTETLANRMQDAEQSLATPTEKPFKVLISFGTEPNPVSEYKFATQAEVDAFIHGVTEMDGYLDYRFVEEKDVWIYDLSEGDQVKWLDPDGGACDRVLTIKDIQIDNDDTVTITDITGDEVGAGFDELEPVVKTEEKSDG
jgi:hypothetical protein